MTRKMSLDKRFVMGYLVTAQGLRIAEIQSDRAPSIPPDVHRDTMMHRISKTITDELKKIANKIAGGA